MISKKTIILLYSVLFVVIILISTVFAFSVNKIDTEYTFLGDDDKKSEVLNEKLSSFFGKNLIFLDTDEISSCINEDPFYDCVSVSKSFPDGVKVVVKERRGVYLIAFGEERYVADENGFIFKKHTGEKTRDLISLTFKDINVEKPQIGSYICTDYDGSVKNAFEIAKSVNLTDRINEMRIVKNHGDTSLTSFDVEFFTYTNVVIKIKKSDDEGVKKAVYAFSAYDTQTTDYEKTFYNIESRKLADGSFQVVWTRDGETSPYREVVK